MTATTARTCYPTASLLNKTERPGFLKVPPTVKDSRKLFVGGLPTDVTEDEFRTFFERFGVIIDSTVMIDRVTHRSRGFGFVTFEEESVSKHLLNQKDGTGKLEMRGKCVEIKQAQPKPSARVVPTVGVSGVTHHYYEEFHYAPPFYPAPVSPIYYPAANPYPFYDPYAYMGSHHQPALVTPHLIQRARSHS